MNKNTHELSFSINNFSLYFVLLNITLRSESPVYTEKLLAFDPGLFTALICYAFPNISVTHFSYYDRKEISFIIILVCFELVSQGIDSTNLSYIRYFF